MRIYNEYDRRAGFTLLGLLIMLAVMGITTAASLRVGMLLQRRDAEQELLHIGGEFRRAVQTYYLMTPAGQKPYPNSLEELVKDPRFPQMVRHLRKIYPDPMTGKADWVPVVSPLGGIMGVHSRSDAQPIKIGNFSDADKDFAQQRKYAAWRFFYTPVSGQGGQ